MRSFSIPQQQQNQQTYERSIYRQVQSLQQQQQQSVENATVSCGEPLSVNGVPASGIYHNGTWYNAVPQYGPYQAEDGQAPLQLVVQQAASQNVPQFEPATYCYQPLQTQEAQTLGYATAYQPMEPQSATNPQAYAYQQHPVQQSQSQSQQQPQVVQLAPTYYYQPVSQTYQPVQMVAGPPTGQPYVAASPSLPQLITAPANAQQQYVTAGSNVQQMLPAPTPAPPAAPPTQQQQQQLMEQPQPQQQHLSSSQSYNYQVYNYQDVQHAPAPSAPPPVGLLPTPDLLPQTAEAFGYQCYNYPLPQSPRSPPAMPSYDPPPMQLGPSTDYIDPETVEVDISMASDVFIARTPEKLVVNLYKLRGRRKPIPGTQNVYINGRVPDCTMSQSKSEVCPDQVTYQNGCHDQDLALAAQSEVTPDAPPAMEAGQCYMEPTEHVFYAQELPERMDSPPNAADQLAPGFHAFNVIDSSNLLECSVVAVSKPMMEQSPLILCNAEMEKKFNHSPNKEATPRPKDVNKKMDVVEQFRAPRRVIQPVNPISTQQLHLVRPCKSELVKNESKYLRNSYISDVGRASKQANKPMRQLAQQKPEMIVKEILKPPPKLSTQEKNEKLLPELLNISSTKSFQANAESAEHINVGFKPVSESTAESFAVETGRITDKLISQVFAGHIVAQLCQTASKLAAPQSTGKPTAQGNSNATLSIFKVPAQVSPTTIQLNSQENSSPTQSIFKVPAQVGLSTVQSSQVNSKATQSNLKLHSPEITEAAAPKTAQLASTTPAAGNPKETPKTTQATAKQAAQEIPKAVFKLSQQNSKTVSKAAKTIPQISKKKAKLLARKNQKPFQPQSQNQIPTKSVLQVGPKSTPKLFLTNYKTTSEVNPKTTQAAFRLPIQDNQNTTLSSQAPSKISAQGTQKTSQPSSKVLSEASFQVAPVASTLPTQENQETTETNSQSSAKEAPKPAQVLSTISIQGTQKTYQVNSKLSAEGSPKSAREAAKQPTQEGFKLPAQVACKLATKENQKTTQTSSKETAEETAKVVQAPTQLPTQENPKTTDQQKPKLSTEATSMATQQWQLPPEVIPKATEVAFGLPTQIVSRLPAQENQKTFKARSKLSPELIPAHDRRFQPSSKLIPEVTLRPTQVASKLFTSENQKLMQTISKVSPEVSPRTSQVESYEKSQLNTKLSLEVSPKASEVDFKVPAQVKSKLLSQGNPKLFQPITQLPTTQIFSQATTQTVSPNKSQLVDATLKCIPVRGANSIILAPSKTIKSLAAKLTMPEKAVGAESKPIQVAAKPTPEFKIVSEVAQPNLKLTPLEKSEANTIKVMQKPTSENKYEAEIKQAKHLIASTNLGLPSKFVPTYQAKPIEQKTVQSGLAFDGENSVELKANQFKAASEGAKLEPMGNPTVELKRNRIEWASEGPVSVELMANQIKVASVVFEPVELEATNLKLVPVDAESVVPETNQIKLALEGAKTVKFEENQIKAASEGAVLIEPQEHQITDDKKTEEPVEPEENQLNSTAEDSCLVEPEETQLELASEGANMVEHEVNQYDESVDLNVYQFNLGTPEHSYLNTSEGAMQSELTASPKKLATPEGAEPVELQSNSNIVSQTSCEQAAKGTDKPAYQEKLKSGSKKQYTAHPTPSDKPAVPESNPTASLEPAEKTSTKPKPRKIDDLMLNVISEEQPIQPFGVQQQSISKKKPAKLSKLERKALRREANKAQNELQAAQKTEEKARARAERIPNDENVKEPNRKKKKKNKNSDTKDVQEDDRNEDSGPEPEIECPALKEVCDPVLRRKLMTIIHKIVNL